MSPYHKILASLQEFYIWNRSGWARYLMPESGVLVADLPPPSLMKIGAFAFAGQTPRGKPVAFRVVSKVGDFRGCTNVISDGVIGVRMAITITSR